MSDDKRKFPRKGGPGKPGGKPGKPGFKSEKQGFGAKPPRSGPKREFAKAGESERGAERPKRDFGQRDRPHDAGGPRPGRWERPGNEDRKRPTSPARRGTGPTSKSGERQRTVARPPRPSEDSERGERIAKRLARAGISSRREAEALIEAGRVRVNGKVLTTPALNVRMSDVIEVDGVEIPPVERTRLFLFHKPAGVVTTNRDPEGRKTVFDILPKDLPRLMTVGRLDINTEGLLLLTNDGGLARVLELPSTGWLRRYRVRVHGKVDPKALEGLKQGIAVDGVFYGAIEATLDREQGSNAWLTVGLREGKNREVKNVLGALGLEVSRLIRTSYGPFQLGELPEGAVLELKGRTLRDQLGQRLVEESGANFSAPIVIPFSNRPVRQGEERAEAAERPRREERERDRAGEGGLIKSRKRQREERREDALGRLQTRKPEGRFKGGGKKPGEREKRRDEPVRSRSSNVWMAPGARPGRKGEPQEGPHRQKFPSPGSRSDQGEGQRKPFRKASDPGDRTKTGQRTSRSSSPAGSSPRKRGEGDAFGRGGPPGPHEGPRKPPRRER